MKVKIPEAAAMSVHEGEFIYFCSPACKEKFDAAPEKFLVPEKVSEEKESALTSALIKNLKKVEVPITGMSCASCVARIEKGLSKMSGIVDAKVNFATEKTTITFDPAAAHVGEFVSAIKDL